MGKMSLVYSFITFSLFSSFCLFCHFILFFHFPFRLASVYEKKSGSFVKHLNFSSELVIKTLHYNKNTSKIMIIYVKRGESICSLYACTLTEEQLHMDISEIKTDLFMNFHIVSPGFIEIDESNQKILTKSHSPFKYSVNILNLEHD